MVFDYQSAAVRVGIRPEDVERLATMARTEFPDDEMMVELHVLRTILAVERGDVALPEVLQPRVAA
jgi:hypothetical protein